MSTHPREGTPGLRVEPEALRAAKSELDAAFPDVAPPADLEVVAPARYYDAKGRAHASGHPPGSEAERIETFFARRRWAQVPAGELLAWRIASSCWPFLSPEARAYYLPAFLRAFLEEPLDDYGFTVLESALRALIPARSRWAGQDPGGRTAAQRHAMEEDRSHDFERFVQAFTPRQKAAVAGILQLLAPAFEEPGLDNPAREAFAYWGGFRP